MKHIIAAGALAAALSGCAPYPVYDPYAYGQSAPYRYANGYAAQPSYAPYYDPWLYGSPGWWLYGPSVYLGYYRNSGHRHGSDWHGRGQWNGNGGRHWTGGGHGWTGTAGGAHAWNGAGGGQSSNSGGSSTGHRGGRG